MCRLNLPDRNVRVKFQIVVYIMDFFSWIVLSVGGLCFALMLLLVWLGPRSRGPGRRWVRRSTTRVQRRPVTPSGAPQTRIATRRME
jgi:hypothetical protein